MTRRQAKFLLTVAEERSLARAAERLGLSAQALTDELMALEADLGAVVLRRTSEGLRLTPAGKAFLAAAFAPPTAAAAPSVADDPAAPAPAPVRRLPSRDRLDGGPRSSRRAVILGVGAVGLAAAGAAVVGWPGAGSRPTVGLRADEGGTDTLTAAAAPPTPAEQGAGAIRAENALPGSPGWVLANDDRVPRSIEGFSDRASAAAGEPVRLYVRARSDTFTVEAYRLGWYGGVKARLIWTSPTITSVDQPPADIDPDTNMVDCSAWEPSLTITPDETWVHGQYLLKLVQPDGDASYIPFVVRSSAPRCEVLVVAAVTTGAAYESWGGHSLYGGLDGGTDERAFVVSLDRPFASGYGGAGWLLGSSSEIGQLLESQGVDVAYATNIDQHDDPGMMQRANLVISASHDEYYSTAMRLGLQAAVDRGVNVMFLGANAIYRKIRLEASDLGPHRRIVNYRSAALDPEPDPNLVTSNWREGPLPLPESSLTANWYESNEAGLSAELVVVDGSAWMFAGTGLSTGATIADGVREEFDRVRPGKPLPDRLQILCHSPLVVLGEDNFADMTYATLPSGAAIFNAGTLRFQQRLGPLSPPNQGGDDGALRRLVWNLVDALRTGPGGTTHPAVSNVATIYRDDDTDSSTLTVDESA